MTLSSGWSLGFVNIIMVRILRTIERNKKLLNIDIPREQSAGRFFLLGNTTKARNIEIHRARKSPMTVGNKRKTVNKTFENQVFIFKYLILHTIS